MAEVFEKPKRFTREWWAYIWHYYKVHFFVVLAIIFLAIVTIVEMTNTVKYDATIHYIGKSMFAQETADRIAEKACEASDDIDGDGKQNLFFSQLNFTPEALQDGGQAMALENKWLTTLASERGMLYIFDASLLEKTMHASVTEGAFVPVSQWCTEQVLPERLLEMQGDFYAVSLEESAIMKELGIDAKDMYLALRMNLKLDEKKLQVYYENCVKIANFLVKE